MREYMVLEARTGPLLTKLVNEKIAYGWTPIGGVSVAITDSLSGATQFQWRKP